MDMSKFSDGDLKQIANGDMRMVSDEGLRMLAAGDTPVEKPRQSMLERFIANKISEKSNMGVGLLRGVKDVVDTGADWLSNLGGADENARVKEMNKAGKAEFNSEYGGNTAASVGRVGGNVLATLPVGGVLGKGVEIVGSKIAPTIAPMVAAALKTGGMSTGAPAAKALSVAGARNAAIRIGGGAASGYSMGALINQEDAGMGAVIGGAIPVVGKVAVGAGKLFGHYVGNPLFKPSRSAINKLIQDAGGEEKAKIAIKKAIAAGNTLSGESFTLGQAGKNWGLAATERARSALHPENYQRIYTAQRDARIAAMQRMAGGADDATRKDALDALTTHRSDSVNDLYASMQDKPFMLGDEGEKLMTRARPYGALTHAEKLAATQGRKFSIPVVEDISNRPQTLRDIENLNASRQTHPDITVGGVPDGMPGSGIEDLLSEIRKLGGVSMKDAKDLFGEKQITKMGVQGGVFTTKGEEVGDMGRRLVDKEVLLPQMLNDVDGGAQALRNAIQDAAMGSDDMANRAAAEAYYGAPEALPGAFKEGISAKPQSIPQEVVGRAVKGSDLQSVKEGIDQVISKAEGPQLRVMVQLKNDYLKFMEGKSPEYIKANNIFSDKSKPITEMAVAQRMLDALTDEAAKHGGEAKQASLRFLQAYRNIPLASGAVSGVRQQPNQVFTPKNLQTVRQVAREIAKHQDLQNLGRGVGSDTAQKLARSNMLTVVRDTIKASPNAMATLNILSTGAKGRIDKRLDALLQNPKLAEKAIAELNLTKRNQLTGLLANPAVRALPIAAQSK